MTRAGFLNAFGVALLVGCFVASAVKLAVRSTQEESGEVVVIRLCHWQLETGMREAFDSAAAAYQKLHPNVRIEQTPVPGRVYGTYVRTRLAGDNPPDIVELGASVSDDWLARHFLPLGEVLSQPNPYNGGTDLEHSKWRETFVDGLGSAPGLETLQDYYAVPLGFSTVRVFYNLPLYRAIVGHDQPPETFEQFMDVCAKVRAYEATTGQTLVPMAGSRFNANVLLDELMRSQTQKLARRLDQAGDLRPPRHPAVAFLQGVGTDDPSLGSGFALMRDVAQQMQPGFLQFDRDEAMFYFAQQRALMICTGSWDYFSIRSQSPFEIGLFKIPLPSTTHPVYGDQVLGRRSEMGAGVGAYFFVAQRSRNAAQATDFLRYLTSRVGNQSFVNVSRGLPVIVGVRPVDEVTPFMPGVDGVPDGFSVAPIMWGSGELYRVQSNTLHLLMAEEGSVDAFVRALSTELPAAVDRDASKLADGQIDSVRRLDAVVAAAVSLEGDSTQLSPRASGALETQAAREASYYWIQHLRSRKKDGR